MKGRVNQDDQACLDEDQIDAGFVLTCVASPMSDCTVETHAEDALYWGRPSAQRVPAVGAYPTVS